METKNYLKDFRLQLLDLIEQGSSAEFPGQPLGSGLNAKGLVERGTEQR